MRQVSLEARRLCLQLRYALVALSSLRHFKVAWEGVLHLIHRELKILEESPTFMGTERERQEFKKRRKQIAVSSP